MGHGDDFDDLTKQAVDSLSSENCPSRARIGANLRATIVGRDEDDGQVGKRSGIKSGEGARSRLIMGDGKA